MISIELAAEQYYTWSVENLVFDFVELDALEFQRGSVHCVYL